MAFNINQGDDSDQIDLDNFKGIHFNEQEGGSKYFDEETGAHFNFQELCTKLNLAKKVTEERENKPIVKIRSKKSKLTVIKIKQKLSEWIVF